MLKGIFNYKNTRFVTMARGSLVSIIMSKILTVSASVAADKGSGTLTLMSADVERIVLGLSMYHIFPPYLTALRTISSTERAKDH